MSSTIKKGVEISHHRSLNQHGDYSQSKDRILFVIHAQLMNQVFKPHEMPRIGQSKCNYQIPELYIPRTDEKPHSCNGVTKDKYGRPFVDNDRGDLTLYAESDDGINWVKPNVGIFTFNGSAGNNIVWDLHGASVFIDREEKNPEKRYKAIGFCRRYRNIFLLTCPS